MKLTVTAYKSTGKFYDSAEIECSKNIELFDDRFVVITSNKRV